MQVLEVSVCSVSTNFKLDVNITKIERKELLSLENPRYNQVIISYSHLRAVSIDDSDDN